MDSIGDILYILFIIAIGIFQLYRKQMKKNAEQQGRPAERREGEKGHPLEEIFGEIFAGAEDGKKTMSPAAPGARAEEALFKAAQKPERLLTKDQNLAVEELTKRKTELWEDKGPLLVEDLDQSSRGLEFDLRKAVIYTAIMKPKFREL